jgi:hypothetical protein
VQEAYAETPYIQVHTSKKSENSKEIPITISLNMPEMNKDLETLLFLNTNDSQKPQKRIPVKVFRAADVNCRPRCLSLGALSQGITCEENVVLYSPYHFPFSLKEVSFGALGSGTFNEAPLTSSGEHNIELHFSIPPDARGTLAEKVYFKVEVNGTESTIEVPIFGSVFAAQPFS